MKKDMRCICTIKCYDNEFKELLVNILHKKNSIVLTPPIEIKLPKPRIKVKK